MNAPTDALTAARTALMDNIRNLPLQGHFSRAILTAAEQFAPLNERWRGPLAWYRPEGGHAHALLGEFLEAADLSREMTVYLYTQFGETALDSVCTCGMTLCAHAAALLIRLRDLIDWPRPMTPLQRWQFNLDRHPASPVSGAAPEAAEVTEARCVVRPMDTAEPCTLLAWIVVRNNEESTPDRSRWVSVDALAPGGALAPRVLLWHARLARLPPSARSAQTGRQLRGPDAAALLAEWLEAGLCRHADTSQHLTWGGPRAPRWDWSLDAQGQSRLRLRLSEDASVRAVDLEGWHYLDEVSGEFGRLTLSPETIAMLRHMPPIPPDSPLRTSWPPHRLLARIPPPPPPPPLHTLRTPLEPILQICAARRAEQNDWVFYVVAWADYGGCRLPLAAEPWQDCVTRQVAGQVTRVFRDIEQEVTAHRKLGRLDLVALSKIIPDGWRNLSPAPHPGALVNRQHHHGGADALASLALILRTRAGDSLHIEYDPLLPFTVLPEKTPLRATLSPTEAAGWTQFQLTALVDGEDIDVLPVVLQGLKRRAFALTPARHEAADAHWLAPLGTHRFLPLGLSRLREWLTPLLTYVGRFPPVRDGALTVPDAQALGLSECLQRQSVAVEGPKAARMAETLAALRAAQRTPCIAPRTFIGTLRPYQKEGLRWLQALRAAALGGVLADDMGLGKTVQVIAHLLAEYESGRLNEPALIVAPTTLVFNWLDEFARFAPSLKVVPCTAATSLESSRPHVLVVSYARLIHDLPSLQRLSYSSLVLDEAQWVKNPFTQTARAVRALQAAHSLVVTGTPLENHLGELWAHFDVVLPGYLGDFASFKRAFRNPIERHQDDRRLTALRQLVAPFVLRRTKAQVAPELPAKTEVTLRIAIGEAQRALYESLRLALSQDVREALEEYSAGQARIVVLSALLRLRQVCCDPRLLPQGTANAPPSAKLKALLELLESLRDEGRQVLVFSQFTSMLALIAQALSERRWAHAILTGETADRRAPVERFQTGEVSILLASLKAGGLGLNLTAADAVIHYDPWWNPAVERQATDRAHRLGREQPIFVYQLLCEDTIEDKIDSMKDRKSDLAQAVLSTGHTEAAGLSESDVRMLFDLPNVR
jgi:superfamily II DNA or RNA helicase